MAVLGMETSSGDFEVIDLCFAGLPEVYRSPEAKPDVNGNVNGKGKGKAEDVEMDVDGTYAAVISESSQLNAKEIGLPPTGRSPKKRRRHGLRSYPVCLSALKKRWRISRCRCWWIGYAEKAQDRV